MNDYIKSWFDILNGMSNDNTYKLAWGRAIIECVITDQGLQGEETFTIDFDLIAYNMLKYYWNQTFFFQLKQSSNQQKPPQVLQLTIELIEIYKKNNSSIPVWFDKALSQLDHAIVKSTLHKISTVLRQDVSWRFMYIDKEFRKIYELDRVKRRISIDNEECSHLKAYGEMLTQLFNYKWAQLLEKYNTAPRIVSKVKGSSENKLKRNNLSKYKDILMLIYEGDAIDFYTGEVISSAEISVDHFIPWSYIYSDDIWNLVITSKSFNSSKSNKPPKEDYIQKLEERNKNLIKIINDEKLKSELILSLEHHYLTTFYLGLIG